MALKKRFLPLWANYSNIAHRLDVGKAMRVLLFPHFLYCRHTLHCNSEEYFYYEFYKIRQNQRKKFLLVYHQRNMYQYVNQKGATRSKFEFANHFPQYFGRGFLNLMTCSWEEFFAFLKKYSHVVLKPNNASYGRNISIISYEDEKQAKALYGYFSGKDFLCEEYIQQHATLCALNPRSVNTIRILALLENDETKIIAAALRAGSGEAVVDNLKHGGIGANVNITTGVVDTDGMDYNGRKYESHPATGRPFMGMQIPFWEESVKMVKELHPQMNQCAVLGWDIAVTGKGPVVVEVNNAPGPMIHQFIDKIPRGVEIIRVMQQAKLKSK